MTTHEEKYDHSSLGGAIPASNVTQDSTHRFATDVEKSSWNAKVAGVGMASITVGISAPGTPAMGDLWVDTN